jgi:hypothetical protein
VTPQQIEAWVLAVVERVTSGLRAEDDRVECKADWISPESAARRIAGHANAARGATILWIIGLDEDGHKVSGTTDADLATWWPQVERCFDQDVWPQMRTIHVPVDSGTAVVALVFETDRAPYVVKTDGQGRVHREVPFRAATGLRTAHRRELLQMVVPATSVPEFEIIQAAVRSDLRVMTGSGANAPSSSIQVSCQGRAFFDSAERSMLPRHRSSAEVHFESAGGSTHVAMADLHFYKKMFGGLSFGSNEAEESHPHGVDAHSGGVYVSGPGALQFGAEGTVPASAISMLQSSLKAVLHLRLGVAGTDQTVRVEIPLTSVLPSDGRGLQWTSERPPVTAPARD